LYSWRNKFISLGGRVVLLYSVLNSIPIYYLSFMKMPSKVWRKVVRIQREFLWGGVEGGRRISWVKWKVVCPPKGDGGLRVRDVRVVNLSLLAKWRWRLLQKGSPFWKVVLREKYGVGVGVPLLSGGSTCPNYASRWWKDVSNLGDGDGLNWKSPAPSKVVVFTWKLLHDRIPTKRNLAIRNSLPSDSSLECVWCNNSVEDSTHLFLHCEGVSMVWCKLMEWVEFNFLIPPNLFILWECWNGAILNKKLRRGVRLIWHAAIWSIWKARNDRIFNNVDIDVEELLESIKVLSWRWCLGRLNLPACLFYEWNWNPKIVCCGDVDLLGCAASWWLFGCYGGALFLL